MLFCPEIRKFEKKQYCRNRLRTNSAFDISALEYFPESGTPSQSTTVLSVYSFSMQLSNYVYKLIFDQNGKIKNPVESIKLDFHLFFPFDPCF
jgi:hypothetical protein